MKKNERPEEVCKRMGEALNELSEIAVKEIKDETKREAKALFIELWQHLADHPEISNKNDIKDADLRERILACYCLCPIAEWMEENHGFACSECSLDCLKYKNDLDCTESVSDWQNWLYAADNETRKAAAERMQIGRAHV